jgi:multiple sugar transport system permease protein
MATLPSENGVSTNKRYIETGKRFMFIAPAILFVIVMMAFPLIYNAYLSLHSWMGGANVPPVFVEFENFTNLFAEKSRFWPALYRTFLFTGVAVTVQMVLGLGIALLLRDAFPGQAIIKTFIMLPMVATPVAIGMAWLLMLEPTIGVFNTMLRDIGLTAQPFLGSKTQALWVLIVIDIWQWTPMMSLIILAGLMSLPSDPYEAALVDGATSWQRFRFVTLPLLIPTLLTGLLLRSIEALKTFDIIYTLTRGGPDFSTETLNTMAYVQAFEYSRMTDASALLVVFFAIVLGFSVIVLQVRKKVEAGY